MEATPSPHSGKLSSVEQCYTDEEAAAQRAATGGGWFWKRLRWKEPQHFLQPGLAGCTVLALRSQCFCWRLQETKQSQGQLRNRVRVLPQSGLEAQQSWAGTETPTPNLFCQPLAFRERWRGAGLETRAAACYSQTQPWIERVAPSTRVGAGRQGRGGKDLLPFRFGACRNSWPFRADCQDPVGTCPAPCQSQPCACPSPEDSSVCIVSCTPHPSSRIKIASPAHPACPPHPVTQAGRLVAAALLSGLLSCPHLLSIWCPCLRDLNGGDSPTLD